MNIVKFWNKKGELQRIRISQSNRNADRYRFRIPTLNDACSAAIKNGWSRTKPRAKVPS